MPRASIYGAHASGDYPDASIGLKAECNPASNCGDSTYGKQQLGR
jgi:hypothetical protein